MELYIQWPLGNYFCKNRHLPKKKKLKETNSYQPSAVGYLLDIIMLQFQALQWERNVASLERNQ